MRNEGKSPPKAGIFHLWLLLKINIHSIPTCTSLFWSTMPRVIKFSFPAEKNRSTTWEKIGYERSRTNRTFSLPLCHLNHFSEELLFGVLIISQTNYLMKWWGHGVSSKAMIVTFCWMCVHSFNPLLLNFQVFPPFFLLIFLLVNSWYQWRSKRLQYLHLDWNHVYCWGKILQRIKEKMKK